MLILSKKVVFTSILSIFTSLSFSSAMYAKIAVVNSNTSSLMFSNQYLGDYGKLFDEVDQTLKHINIKYTLLSDDELKKINASEYEVIILPLTVDLPADALKGLTTYVNDGGKIIVSYPEDLDTITIKKLAELSGADLKGKLSLGTASSVNYLGEKSIVENDFPANIKTVSLKPDSQSKTIAVWGQEEENIPAAVIDNNGSYLGWRWGNDGNISFNSAFMETVLDNLSPGIIKKEQINFNSKSYKSKIAEIDKFRSKANTLLETSSNTTGSNNRAEIQESLYLSRLNEKLANSSFNDFDYEKAIDYIKKSRLDALNAYAKAVPSNLVEARTLWLDRGTIVSIKNPKEMSILFDRIQKTGINVVYFETVNAGFTVYPSSIGTQNPMTKGWDPLYWAVKEAHKRNIELHSWCWIFAAGNTRHNPIIYKNRDYSGPILTKNADWALKGEKGNLIPISQNEYWLDPANPKVRTYLNNLLKEIASNYDVDGIQLDYIRYPFQRNGNLMGFNCETQKRFEADTGFCLKNVNYETVKVWNNWKTKQISSFVKDVSDSLRKIKPDIVISAAVFGGNRQSRVNSIQQDWETWVNNGWVDVLNPMIYANNTEKLSENLDYIIKAVDNKAFVYPGIAIRQLEAPDLLEQIYAINEMGLKGNTLFAMAHLGTEKSKLLANGPYRYKEAKVPSKNTLSSARMLIEEFLYKLNDIKSQELFRKSRYADLALAQAAMIHNSISGSPDDIDSYSLSKVIDAVNYLTSIMQMWEEEQISPANSAKIKFMNKYLKDAGALLTFEQHKLSVKELK
ncbi:MAG: family 10 glycosylhydrolase [bacterium]